jgi:hypothetical protein
LVHAAAGYLRHHPEEVVRVARNALGLRFGLPLAALRWLAAELSAGRRGPEDLELEAVPPGIRAAATLDLMGNRIRASAVVTVDEVRFNADELRVGLRLADVSVALRAEAKDSPVATLLKSGALDLSKPGNLAAYMPKRPAMLVEAKDDRVVLDLMKLPAVAQNPKLIRAIRMLTPVLSVSSVETDWEHLDVVLEAFPQGVADAVQEMRRAL